jgi:hypothetical protein
VRLRRAPHGTDPYSQSFSLAPFSPIIITTTAGTVCNSITYWILAVLVLPWILVIFFAARRVILREHRVKADCGYPFVNGDVHWCVRGCCVCIGSLQ